MRSTPPDCASPSRSIRPVRRSRRPRSASPVAPERLGRRPWSDPVDRHGGRVVRRSNCPRSVIPWMRTPRIASSPSASRPYNSISYVRMAVIAAWSVPSAGALLGHTLRPPDPLEVLDRGQHTGHAFEIRRPSFEPVVRGTHLVRGQRIQQVALAVQHARVGPEELVRGAHDEISIDRVHVHRSVRREMHRIDVRQRADLVGPEDDVRNAGDRPDRIRRPAERDELCLRPEGVVERRQVQAEIVGPDIDRPDRRVPILRHRQPRIDVGLVVEVRHHDLVAGRQRRADRPAEVERQGGHVAPNLIDSGCGRAEQVGHRNVRLVRDRIVSLAGREGTPRHSRSIHGNRRRPPR